MKTSIPCTFVTVADGIAPLRLCAVGFHLDMPSQSELLMWGEDGSTILFRPHPDLEGFLRAEIDTDNLAALLAIVEPGAFPGAGGSSNPCNSLWISAT